MNKNTIGIKLSAVLLALVLVGCNGGSDSSGSDGNGGGSDAVGGGDNGAGSGNGGSSGPGSSYISNACTAPDRTFESEEEDLFVFIDSLVMPGIENKFDQFYEEVEQENLDNFEFINVYGKLLLVSAEPIFLGLLTISCTYEQYELDSCANALDPDISIAASLTGDTLTFTSTHATDGTMFTLTSYDRNYHSVDITLYENGVANSTVEWSRSPNGAEYFRSETLDGLTVSEFNENPNCSGDAYILRTVDSVVETITAEWTDTRSDSHRFEFTNCIGVSCISDSY